MLLVDHRKRIEKIVMPFPSTYLANDANPENRCTLRSRVPRNRICNPVVDYPDLSFIDSQLPQRPCHGLRDTDKAAQSSRKPTEDSAVLMEI